MPFYVIGATAEKEWAENGQRVLLIKLSHKEIIALQGLEDEINDATGRLQMGIGRQPGVSERQFVERLEARESLRRELEEKRCLRDDIMKSPQFAVLVREGGFAKGRILERLPKDAVHERIALPELVFRRMMARHRVNGLELIGVSPVDHEDPANPQNKRKITLKATFRAGPAAKIESEIALLHAKPLGEAAPHYYTEVSRIPGRPQEIEVSISNLVGHHVPMWRAHDFLLSKLKPTGNAH